MDATSAMGGISLALIPLPDFPPPPPIPSFMASLLIKDNLTESCDLCSKWGDSSLLTSGSSPSSDLTFMLAMVAVISALSGAGIMAAILSIRRLRKRGSLRTDSMRHLERKCSEHNNATLPLPPSRSTNSTPLSNTYCEGPYTDNGSKEGVGYPCNNIYAELHSSAGLSIASGSVSDIWRRPPIPVPPLGAGTGESCYLELRDLPGVRCGISGMNLPTVTTPLFSTPHQCHGHGSRSGSGRGGGQGQSQPQSPGTYSLSPSNTTTASYYTDLEVKNGREIR